MSNFKAVFDDFKEKYPDALILMREEEMYSLYNEDARRAAPALGITPQPIIGGWNMWYGSHNTPSTPTCLAWCGQGSASASATCRKSSCKAASPTGHRL